MTLDTCCEGNGMQRVSSRTSIRSTEAARISLAADEDLCYWGSFIPYITLIGRDQLWAIRPGATDLFFG